MVGFVFVLVLVLGIGVDAGAAVDIGEGGDVSFVSVTVFTALP